MKTLANGGPAFPGKTLNGSDVLLFDEFGELLSPGLARVYPGMTLRDYFASAALQGLIADPELKNFEGIARLAYACADAMLAERTK